MPETVPGWEGFVLVGGHSSRMGRDKALIPIGRGGDRLHTLAGWAGRTMEQATGSVHFLGDPALYSNLGRTIADVVPNCGPMSGLHAALACSKAEWNLILACDMPFVEVEVLRRLIQAAARSEALCVAPVDELGRVQPLCAAYSRRLLPQVTRALETKRLKMKDFLTEIGAELWTAPVGARFENINTPDELESLLAGLRGV